MIRQVGIVIFALAATVAGFLWVHGSEIGMSPWKRGDLLVPLWLTLLPYAGILAALASPTRPLEARRLAHEAIILLLAIGSLQVLASGVISRERNPWRIEGLHILRSDSSSISARSTAGVQFRRGILRVDWMFCGDPLKAATAQFKGGAFEVSLGGRLQCVPSTPCASGTIPLIHSATGPAIYPAALLATYPAVAFIRGPLRRYRRRRKGLCLKCGYDLTGNVSGVCPECGAEVKSRWPTSRGSGEGA